MGFQGCEGAIRCPLVRDLAGWVSGKWKGMQLQQVHQSSGSMQIFHQDHEHVWPDAAIINKRTSLPPGEAIEVRTAAELLLVNLAISTPCPL